MKKPLRKKWFFQLNPPFRVGEILLRNVKSSLCSGEIAAAVGGFNFTETIGFDFTKGKAFDFTVRQHDFTNHLPLRRFYVIMHLRR